MLYVQTEEVKVYENNELTIHAVQGEGNARKLIFHLIETPGDYMSTGNAEVEDKMLDVTDCNVSLYVTKPDGNSVLIPGEIEDGENGGISFLLSPGAFTDAGKASCFIQIVSGESFLKIVGLKINILPADTGEAYEADEFPYLEALAISMQQKPCFANDSTELTDTGRVYVMPDGYLYAYMYGWHKISGNDNLVNRGSSDWENNVRLNGTGGEETISGFAITDYIDVTNLGTVRIKGLDIINAVPNSNPETYFGRLYFYDENKDIVETGETNQQGAPYIFYISPHDRPAVFTTEEQENGIVVTKFNWASVTEYRPIIEQKGTKYIRLGGFYTSDDHDVVVTNNAEIVEDVYERRYTWANTGHAFVPGDYEDRIIAAERSIDLHSVDILDIKEKAKYLPDYYTDYLAQKASDVNALQNGRNKFSFAFFSDSHMANGSNAGYAGRILKYICDKCNINTVLFGGDAEQSAYPADASAAKASLQLFDDMVSDIKGKLICTRGNHDGTYGSGGSKNLTNEEVYNGVFRKNELKNGIVMSTNGTYCYYDDPIHKVRYIELNTIDHPYEENQDGTPVYNGQRYFSMAQAQINWLIDALDVDEGYTVLAFTHIPPTHTYSYAVNAQPSDPNEQINTGAWDLIRGLLECYEQKTVCKSEFIHAQPNNLYNDENALSSISIDGNGNTQTAITSNEISVAKNDVLRWRNIELSNAAAIEVYDAEQNKLADVPFSAAAIEQDSTGVWKWEVGVSGQSNNEKAYYDFADRIAYVKISGQKPDYGSVIITVNESIWNCLCVNVDFTNYKGSFAALFTGHIHSDYIYPKSDYGINICTVSCDGRMSNNPYINANNYPAYGGRALGTVYEHCIDIVTVDTESRTVNCTRIGAGADRSFTY